MFNRGDKCYKNVQKPPFLRVVSSNHIPCYPLVFFALQNMKWEYIYEKASFLQAHETSYRLQNDSGDSKV